jgi:sortase (surface protein transpeptidase)
MKKKIKSLMQMNKVLILIILISNVLFAYTDKDWKVYNGCKERVYENKSNEYD